MLGSQPLRSGSLFALGCCHVVFLLAAARDATVNSRLFCLIPDCAFEQLFKAFIYTHTANSMLGKVDAAVLWCQRQVCHAAMQCDAHVHGEPLLANGILIGGREGNNRGMVGMSAE
jgi:hypothetical protein